MEGHMEIIDKYVLEQMVKSVFPTCIINSIWQHYPFFHVEFCLKNMCVVIDGDISFDVEIIIDDTKYKLWQYDRIVINYMKTTKKNIIFQLNVLKRFSEGL